MVVVTWTSCYLMVLDDFNMALRSNLRQSVCVFSLIPLNVDCQSDLNKHPSAIQFTVRKKWIESLLSLMRNRRGVVGESGCPFSARWPTQTDIYSADHTTTRGSLLGLSSVWNTEQRSYVIQHKGARSSTISREFSKPVDSHNQL